MEKIIKDESAQAISLDFVTAVVLFMIAIAFVYNGLPDIADQYTGESAKMYSIADQMSEKMVKDSKIGFANGVNILNATKVDNVFFGYNSPEWNNETWWEFGSGVSNSTTTYTYDDVRSAFLGWYNCYIQIRPLNNFNETGKTLADDHVYGNVSTSGDLVMIERIISMENDYYKIMIWVWG